MSRALSLASVIEKAKTSSNTPYLIALDVYVKDQSTKVIQETLRFIANDEDVEFEGNTYQKAIFDVRYTEEAGGVGSASITVNDFKQIIKQREESYGGLIGSTVKIMVINIDGMQRTQSIATEDQVWADDVWADNLWSKETTIEHSATEYKPDVELFYDITASSSTDWTVSWTLGSENALALPFPRFKQRRDRCRFRYKDQDCGYSGGLATCDLSLDGSNGCTAHSNEINFGGFPGINSES